MVTEKECDGRTPSQSVPEVDGVSGDVGVVTPVRTPGPCPQVVPTTVLHRRTLIPLRPRRPGPGYGGGVERIFLEPHRRSR